MQKDSGEGQALWVSGIAMSVPLTREAGNWQRTEQFLQPGLVSSVRVGLALAKPEVMWLWQSQATVMQDRACGL